MSDFTADEFTAEDQELKELEEAEARKNILDSMTDLELFREAIEHYKSELVKKDEEIAILKANGNTIRDELLDIVTNIKDNNI